MNSGHEFFNMNVVYGCICNLLNKREIHVGLYYNTFSATCNDISITPYIFFVSIGNKLYNIKFIFNFLKLLLEIKINDTILLLQCTINIVSWCICNLLDKHETQCCLIL